MLTSDKGTVSDTRDNWAGSSVCCRRPAQVRTMSNVTLLSSPTACDVTARPCSTVDGMLTHVYPSSMLVSGSRSCMLRAIASPCGPRAWAPAHRLSRNEDFSVGQGGAHPPNDLAGYGYSGSF
ncbi:MAG: hypothetical protein JWO42_267 [Chloroflexi bacterium]|nr:hypothetical protein [Chloroflexota bacterium]